MSLTTTERPAPRRKTMDLGPTTLTPGISPRPYLHRKGPLERVFAACLLLVFLPVIAILVAVVRLTSRGPGIFRQVRVGRGGVHYTMYKLRTMRCDAEAGTGAVWAKQNDDRMTGVGRWLRRLHLDELPQLWNVVRGEMSLVGPRPERPEFTHWLIRELPGYRDRLTVLPGITGLAQINLPPDTDLNSVRRKLYLDRQYIETATLAMDFRMLACSALRLVGIPGGLAMKLMGLVRHVPASVCPPAETSASANGNRHANGQHLGLTTGKPQGAFSAHGGGSDAGNGSASGNGQLPRSADMDPSHHETPQVRRPK